VIGLRHRLVYWDTMTGPGDEVIARLESTAAQMSQDLGPAHEVTRARVHASSTGSLGSDAA
jgi:hypothetical protein